MSSLHRALLTEERPDLASLRSLEWLADSRQLVVTFSLNDQLQRMVLTLSTAAEDGWADVNIEVSAAIPRELAVTLLDAKNTYTSTRGSLFVLLETILRGLLYYWVRFCS